MSRLTTIARFANVSAASTNTSTVALPGDAVLEWVDLCLAAGIVAGSTGTFLMSLHVSWNGPAQANSEADDRNFATLKVEADVHTANANLRLDNSKFLSGLNILLPRFGTLGALGTCSANISGNYNVIFGVRLL